MPRKTVADLKVGDTIWLYDNNRRRYPAREPGALVSTGGPIWESHWREQTITGETSRSFVVGDGDWKLPKNGAAPKLPYACSRVALDIEGIRDAKLFEMVYGITEALRRRYQGRWNDDEQTTAALALELRQLAALAGVNVEPDYTLIDGLEPMEPVGR